MSLILIRETVDYEVWKCDKCKRQYITSDYENLSVEACGCEKDVD